MAIGTVALLFVIVIVLIVLAGILAIFVARNFPSEKYDERQQIDRGNAYRFSFWVGSVYSVGLVGYLVFHTGKAEWVVEPFLLVMIGILIQLQSFHIYCLMTHSALPLGEKPLPTMVSNALLGIMYLLQYDFQYIPEDAVGITGAGSFNVFRLLLALSFFSLAIMHLISHLRKEKD